MMNRILVAVADSPPAIAAANYATKLAKSQGADLHLVTVSDPTHRSEQALNHLTNLARKAGVTTTSTMSMGDRPFEVLLALAHDWNADLIVMGRSDSRRPGVPYVGSQTEHLLEFTDIPVLVVPYPAQLATSIRRVRGKRT